MDFAGLRSDCSSDDLSETQAGNPAPGPDTRSAAPQQSPGQLPVYPPAPPPWYPAAPFMPPPAGTPPFYPATSLPPSPAVRPSEPPLTTSAPGTSPALNSDAAPQQSVAAAAASIFRIERARLLGTQMLNWERVRAVLWVLVVGVALGSLLLIPQVHTLPMAMHPAALRTFPPVIVKTTLPRPLWASILVVIGIGAPLVALAFGLLVLLPLLWREARLRRQGDLHLAIGRQGLLFFLPGQPRHWFLLPWGHIISLNEATIAPNNGRRLRLRTVLWRRLARLQRAFRHGHRLGEAPSARRPVRSPFTLRARNQQPRQRLLLTCYARLPDVGYDWLFRLAPFTPRAGVTSLMLETGWFEAARPSPPATPGADVARQKEAGSAAASLHRILLALWQKPSLRAQRPLLPLPRSTGAVILNAPVQGTGPEARRVDLAAWAALPLVPALSIVGAGITLAMRQPVSVGAALNLATLCVLTLGLGLLLAGAARATRRNLFVAGAALLALAGALNIVYALNVLLLAWSPPFQAAPGEPFLYLELLVGLLIMLGTGGLAMEGAGRPGARPAASLSADTASVKRAHSAELALALGLLALGLARPLEDINQAVMTRGTGTLLVLRTILAEPALPLAIIGLSYFAPLASPALRQFLRTLQRIYGVALALLVPIAFILVYRATGGQRLLPLEWTPLLALMFVCGLLVTLGRVPIRSSLDG